MKKFFKKAACAVMATVMTAGVCAFSASALLGDLNDSGKLQSSDARLLLRYSAKLESLDDAHLALADFNYDGRVNSGDARILLRAAAKIEDLEYYKNYYFEMDDGAGTVGSFGYLDGTVFAEANMMGMNMAMLYETNGDFTFIDHAGSRYAVLTASDQKALANLMKSQGGEDFDFKEILEASTEILPEMPTPLKLLDDGFVKSEGEWNGAPADVYTLGDSTYYYNGKTLLAIGAGNQKITYRNFTEDPEQFMYSFRSKGYRQVDFIEMMMEMAGSSDLPF